MKITFWSRYGVPLCLAATILFMASCTWILEPPELEPGDSVQDTTMDTGNQAFINTVEIVQQDDGFYAVVTGWFPDTCSTTDEIVQQVDGDTIGVTITSKRPVDKVCATMLTEFEEMFMLDTEALEPGEYIVVVNDVSANTPLSIE